MRHRLGISLTLLLLLVAVPAAAGTSTAASHNGLGSLAVDWAVPVAIDTEARGRSIEIRASRPFPSDITAHAAALHPLVERAELDETATLLVLEAAAGATIETAVLDDRSLRIALVPNDAPTIGLRLGRHADFERVVLEPVREHAVRQDQRGTRLTLTLPGTLRPADRNRLAAVGGIERLAVAGHLLVLDLTRGTRVRPLFVGPDRQVFDVYTGGGVGAEHPGQPPPERVATTAGPTASPAVQPPRPKPTEAASIGPTASTTPAVTLAAERAVTAEPFTAVSPPWTAPAASPVAIAAERLGPDAIELRFTWPEPVPAAVFMRGSQLWVAFAAANAGIELEPASFTPAARRFVGAVREESHPAATLIRLGLTDEPVVTVARNGGTWRIGLRAGRPDATTAGRRNTPEPARAPPTLPGLVLAGLDAVVSLVDPVVGDRIGIGMALDAVGPVAAPARFIGLRLLDSAQGAVWQQLGEPMRNPFWTTAGLYLGPPEGVVRTLPDDPALPAPLLEALPLALDRPDDAPAPSPAEAATAHEAAGNGPGPSSQLAAAMDDVVADSSRPLGETGSVSPAVEPPASADTIVAVLPGLLDLARFRPGPGRGFWEQRSALVQAAEAADRPDPLALAHELARLHLAHGLGPEAAALLAEAPAPSILEAPATTTAALQGAAAFVAGRYAEANERLGLAALRADDETALWRGAALAALERWDEALPDWRRGEPWLAGYSPVAQAILGEHGVMLLLQTGRIDEALALLEQLAQQPVPAAAAERLRELEAIALERDGAIDEARGIWRELHRNGSPEARSRALLALTLSDLEAGRLETEAAIDQLVADSVHWRGQSDEIAKRRRLAALQRAADRTEAALATLQEALAGDPPAAAAALITSDMTAIVDGLFDDLAAGRRSATATLLLYRRFAELVPRGREGDAKVAGLAEALGELGLDAAAIEILRSRLQQSDERDAGRAALGYALASRLARSGNGREAMAALVDSTPIAAIDEALAAARRELFAAIGSAGGAGVGATASDAAEPDWAPLREQARQAFDGRNWGRVLERATAVEAQLPRAGRLDPQASEIVLMAATAARQLGDDTASDRLATRYADRLATAADNAVLRLLAGTVRFSGAAADVLGEAASYTRAMRRAIADMPSL